jgi:hypothetical protein
MHTSTIQRERIWRQKFCSDHLQGSKESILPQAVSQSTKYHANDSKSDSDFNYSSWSVRLDSTKKFSMKKKCDSIIQSTNPLTIK